MNQEPEQKQMKERPDYRIQGRSRPGIVKFNREFILPEDQENGSTGKEIRIFKNKTVKAKDDRQHRRNADFKH